MHDPSIVVTTSSRAGAAEIRAARNLAARLGAAWVSRAGMSLQEVARASAPAVATPGEAAVSAVVVVEARRTVLVMLGEGGAEVGVFFFHPCMAPTRIRRLSKGLRDPMVDAMGLRRGDSVLDCTLGLGADSIVASWIVGGSDSRSSSVPGSAGGEGGQGDAAGTVVGVEASMVMAELVRDGLQTYDEADEEVCEAMRRIQVVCAHHLDYLKACPDRSFDIVYFDPMFRDPIRSSPGIGAVRAWACSEPLSPEAVREGTRVARRRIVVKDRRDGGELERLGISVRTGGRYSRVEYGTIELHAEGAADNDHAD